MTAGETALILEEDGTIHRWEEEMPDMPDTSGIFKFLDDFRNWFDNIPRMPKI